MNYLGDRCGYYTNKITDGDVVSLIQTDSPFICDLDIAGALLDEKWLADVRLGEVGREKKTFVESLLGSS